MWKRKRNEKRQILGSCKRAKESEEHEGNGGSNCSFYAWNDTQRPGKETEGTRYQRTNRNNPDHSTFKISSNTQKHPGDLMKFAFTQTSVKKNFFSKWWEKHAKNSQ